MRKKFWKFVGERMFGKQGLQMLKTARKILKKPALLFTAVGGSLVKPLLDLLSQPTDDIIDVSEGEYEVMDSKPYGHSKDAVKAEIIDHGKKQRNTQTDDLIRAGFAPAETIEMVETYDKDGNTIYQEPSPVIENKQRA
ncbi:MAG: hypothetical protein ACTSXQ_08005 [Alphaproteobacteria bacterium]